MTRRQSFKSNPLKWQSQATAYREAWKLVEKLMARYRTVPTVERGNHGIRPDVVYALKINKALSTEAFANLEDAYKVAQNVADSWGIPVEIIDKVSRRVESIVTTKRKR